MEIDNNNFWQVFAKATDGKFVVKSEGWLSDRTAITYKDWSIFFDYYQLYSNKHSTVLTRVIVPVVTLDKFRFEIYRTDIVHTIQKLFGAQDIKIGYTEFDKSFVIKSNNELKIKSLLRNEQIRNFIENEEEINLELSDKKGVWEGTLPENELELQFYVDGCIENMDYLKTILHFFQLMLDELCQMKSIENHSPIVEQK